MIFTKQNPLQPYSYWYLNINLKGIVLTQAVATIKLIFYKINTHNRSAKPISILLLLTTILTECTNGCPIKA